MLNSWDVERLKQTPVSKVLAQESGITLEVNFYLGSDGVIYTVKDKSGFGQKFIVLENSVKYFNKVLKNVEC